MNPNPLTMGSLGFVLQGFRIQDFTLAGLCEAMTESTLVYAMLIQTKQLASSLYDT